LGASSREITAESEIEVYVFAQTRGANLCELKLGGEIFSGEPQNGKHIDLAL
jgi:hypothetical protein